MKKIEISPVLILELCLLAYCLPMEVFSAFLVASALHEAAHIILCKLLHVPITSFSLGACGAELAARFQTARQEALCILAGPAVNFLCVLLFFRFPNFALFSLLLGLYNFLPLQALDGGRLLELLTLCIFSFDKAEAICKFTEITVIVLLISSSIVMCCILHAGLWSILFCALLLARSKVSENILLFSPQRRKIKKKHVEGEL